MDFFSSWFFFRPGNVNSCLQFDQDMDGEDESVGRTEERGRARQIMENDGLYFRMLESPRHPHPTSSSSS